MRRLFQVHTQDYPGVSWMMQKSPNACYLGTGLIFAFVVVRCGGGGGEGKGEEIDVGAGYWERDCLQNLVNRSPQVGISVDQLLWKCKSGSFFQWRVQTKCIVQSVVISVLKVYSLTQYYELYVTSVQVNGKLQIKIANYLIFFYQTVCERSASSERGEAKAC